MTELRNHWGKNTSTEIVQDNPAVAYVKPLKMEVSEEMRIALPFESKRYGTMYHEFTVASVFGYAVKNNSCPIKAMERAKENGHAVYYIFPNAVVLTVHKEAKKVVPAFTWGDEIKFLGKKFRIEKAPNDNARLVEVEA
ncbi:hypothetical protein [uncultured Roseibium sp.]|uniref:hypothetical protein n=1 Tax=uncultured Roseibium sp. TaxID=1936171 RepID=UPI0026047C43|nr:hypothetical protein [uncultured Roseibium sp.]